MLSLVILFHSSTTHTLKAFYIFFLTNFLLSFMLCPLVAPSLHLLKNWSLAVSLIHFKNLRGVIRSLISLLSWAELKSQAFPYNSTLLVLVLSILSSFGLLCSLVFL